MNSHVVFDGQGLAFVVALPHEYAATTEERPASSRPRALDPPLSNASLGRSDERYSTPRALPAGSLAAVTEWTNMRIRRVVPDIIADDLTASRAFYGDLLGFDIGMDLGWAINFVAPDNPTAQVIVMDKGRTAAVEPDMTIEVDDVDQIHAQAVELGYEVVRPITDEPWGVRRFFVRDPDGTVVNVLSHSGPAR